MLERHAFNLDRILEIEPAFLDQDEQADDHFGHHDHDHHGHDHDHDHHGHDHNHDHDHKPGGLKHYHDEDMQSVAIVHDGDLDPQKFMPWLNDLVQREGQKILRSKGILAFKGEPKRFVFQGVHMMLDGDMQRDWQSGEKRASKLVFIGRDLPEEAIRKGFSACLA